MDVPARPPLSRDRIVEAAMEMADAGGVPMVSMRKLGAALGVEAMSLYNHVKNKDELLDAMLDAALREVVLPDTTLVWDEQLAALAQEFRLAGRRHPGVLPLFGTRAIRSLEGFAPLERSFVILRQAGLAPDDALDAFMMLASFVLGYVTSENGGLREVAEGRSIDFSTIDFVAHPFLIEMGEAFVRHDGDREFQFGLDVLIDGIRQRLT